MALRTARAIGRRNSSCRPPTPSSPRARSALRSEPHATSKEKTLITKKHVAATLTCLGLAACSAGSEETATGFVQDVAAGRTAEALERVDPEMNAALGPMAGMAVSANGVASKKRGGLKAVRVVKTTTIDADHATVQMEKTAGDGTTSSETENLRRKQGRWYVTM